MSGKTVAIIGRPNVGKSTLFNVLAEENVSIVSSESGVTRDRIYAKCNWRGASFDIIDTGGIEQDAQSEIYNKMREQSYIAMEVSDLIVFVVDIKQGLNAQDEEIANMLRKTKKKIILVCNKIDNVGKPPLEIYELYKLGLGEPICISAKAKLGIGELLDEIYSNLNLDIEEAAEANEIKVAIIGRPNAGKSSLINEMLKEERTIVSNEAGTTRDATFTKLSNAFGDYVIIDTAGIRKQNKIFEDLEKISIIKAKAAIQKADVCVILVDATEGVTEQDEKIAGIAHELGKAMIIAVNKWDLVDKTKYSTVSFEKEIRKSFKFMSYAPIITVSALTGKRVDDIFEVINKVYKANNFRISTPLLNDIIIDELIITPPPTDKGRKLKIYYATQVKTKPPTFVIFVNDKKLAHFSYLRHLENVLRRTIELNGTPINIIVRERGEKENV